MFLSKETISQALHSLQGTADHMIKIWFVLKALGLTNKKSVFVDTSNSSDQLNVLFHSGNPEGEFCVPFAPMESKYRFMKNDAARSIIQTNIKKWMDGTVSGSDPRSFLDIKRDGSGYRVSAQPTYPDGLGSDERRFAPTAHTKTCIPLLEMAVWVFAQKEIPNDEPNIGDYLRQALRNILNLQPDEERCVFVPGTLELSFSDAPISDAELFGICSGSTPSPTALAGTEDFPKQLIYYGAPGCGKSFKTDEITNVFDDTIRVTFHPDSDYASFVGCYKPAMRKRPRTTFSVSGTGFKVEKGPAEPAVEDYIAYDFVPQAFAKAYVQAWEKMAVATTGGKPEPQFLAIEEINRGNCAQIFGDLFQLLDRDDNNGFSKYPIDPSADFAKHLRECFRGEYVSGDGTNSANIVSGLDEKTKAKVLTSGKPGVTWNDVVEGRKLVLPPNLFIWATMNTSDQSLFPMDSAFKRRWDWEYIPIRNHPVEDYRIEIGNELYPWWPFVSEINKRILSATDSEDKKLGYFFVKAEKNSDGRNVIDAGKFLNKVVFYLWNDVFKNSEPEKAFKFDRPDGKKDIAAFQDFFKEEDGSRDEEMLKAFLKGLGVEAQVGENAENMPAAPPASSPADAAPAAPAAPASSPAMIG